MTLSFSTTIAIAAVLLGHSLCAQAQLSPEQMQAARKVVADGKEQAAKDLMCQPAVIPAIPVKTQEALDAIEAAHEKQRHCVQELEEVATDAFLERAVAQRFSTASPEQKTQLVRLFQEAMEPMRAKALADLKTSTQSLLDSAHPFLLRQTIQDAMRAQEAQCVEPYIVGLLPLKDTPAYLRLYDTFDACLETLRNEVDKWDNQGFVNKHFSGESPAVRSQLVQDMPAIKKEWTARLQRRMDKARNSPTRQKAMDYLNAEGKTRMPEE